MISSPCRNCPGKKMPKDECIKRCETLQEVQSFQTTVNDAIVSTQADFTEEASIIINGREFAY